MIAFDYAVLPSGSVWLTSNIRQAGIPLWGASRSPDGEPLPAMAALAWFAVAVGGSLSLWANNTGVIFLASCILPLAVIVLCTVRRNQTSTWAIYNGLACGGVILQV